MRVKTNSKGITLVALIITVIVLLILAMVSISLVINSGIIDKAKYGVDKYSEQEEFEQVQLAVTSAQLKGNGFLTADTLNSELQAAFNNNKTVTETSIGWFLNLDKSYRIYKDGHIENADLPAEYQQVEYIYSTGTQYINTEIKASSKIEIELVVDRPISPANGTIWLPFGSDDDTTNGQFRVFESTSGVGKYVAVRYGKNSISNLINNGGATSYTKSKFIFRNGILSFDNGIQSITSSQNGQTFTTTNNIYLFSIPNTSSTYLGSTIYYIKMWENQILVRNFIPCYRISDDVNGLYDTITGQFYTNQGSGTFERGNNV